MPFDWMHVSRPPADKKLWEEQYVRGIKRRAQLLCNLRYSLTAATSRIQADVAWEFDSDIASTPLPRFYATIPKLVKSVYEHATGPKKTPKSTSRK